MVTYYKDKNRGGPVIGDGRDGAKHYRGRKREVPKRWGNQKYPSRSGTGKGGINRSRF